MSTSRACYSGGVEKSTPCTAEIPPKQAEPSSRNQFKVSICTMTHNPGRTVVLAYCVMCQFRQLFIATNMLFCTFNIKSYMWTFMKMHKNHFLCHDVLALFHFWKSYRGQPFLAWDDNQETTLSIAKLYHPQEPYGSRSLINGGND